LGTKPECVLESIVWQITLLSQIGWGTDRRPGHPAVVCRDV